MTVSVEDDRRGPYPGDGVTVQFNGPMAYLSSQLFLYSVEADGTATLIPSGYSVSNFGRSTGTKIVMDAPIAVGLSLLILRVVPYSQTTDISNQGAFNADSVEHGYDNLEFQIQQVARMAQFSLRLPVTSTLPISMVMPTPFQPLHPLVSSADGLRLEFGDPTGTGDMLLRPDLASGTSGKGASLITYKRSETGAVARSVNDKLQDLPSVKDFGVVGDGVTDDTAAFNLAFLRLAGKEIAIPSGSYKLTGPLTISGGTKIRGAGKKNTLLFFTLPASSTARLMAINEGGVTSYGGGISDLAIVDQTPTPATTCIYVEDMVEADFENIQTVGGRVGFHFVGGDNDMHGCLISSLAGVMSQTIGVLADAFAGLGIFECMVQNSTAPANQARYGYVFQGGASPTMMKANTYGVQIGCHLTATGVAMLWPEIVDCQFDTASDTGLLIDTGAGGAIYGLSVINVWCATFTNYGIHIVPGSGLISGLNFNGGRVFGCQGVGIWIEGGSSLVFEGMNIGGNGNSVGSGVLISGAVNGVTFKGNRIGPSSGLSNTQVYGIQIQGIAAQNVTIVGNDLSGNITNGLINGSTSTSVKISGNAGFDVAAIAPTLLGTWVNNGGVTGTAGYWKDENNVVHLSGLIKNGTLATSAFTLPVGYRPLFDRYFPTIANGVVGLCIVQQSGAVIPQSGSNVYFSLDGCYFKTT